MDNKALQAFFNGAFDLLNASFAASKMLSHATKGASRENAARELLRSLIPPVARVESGDVIDTSGHRTGQLDAVVVDHRSPTLKLGASETSLIFAEGALAILEIKSDITKQWDEVVRTFARVEPLRPVMKPLTDLAKNKEKYPGIHKWETHRRSGQQSIPFIVVAGKGWKNHERLARLAEELRGVLPEKRYLELLLVTLDPPTFSSCEGWTVTSGSVPHKHRGDLLAGVWFMVVNEARLHSTERSLRRLPLHRYFKDVPAPSTKAEPPAPTSEKRPQESSGSAPQVDGDLDGDGPAL